MPYTQEDREMAITTPLGSDVLLLVGLHGREAISELFKFRIDLVSEQSSSVVFDQLLGKEVTVKLHLPDDKLRYFSGIVSRFSQGGKEHIQHGSESVEFTRYLMEVVPRVWLLTRKTQSRIFQQMSVPDILKKVFTGLDVSYQIQGTFEPREYCVQYRETDFDFASRLMEEEGIYYFFKHTDGSHQMVLGNTPTSHPEVPEASEAAYDEVAGGASPEDAVIHWEKVQEIRSGKYTLWDHCFELPHKHLDANKPILESVTVGTTTHKLKVGGNDQLEIYDYPGGYAKRFDGIDKGGGDQASQLQKIFEDNSRTVGIRMQAEAVPSLVAQGAGFCRQFTSGHKFKLKEHFSDNGEYVLTSVTHAATQPLVTGPGQEAFKYGNSFNCIPVAVPYRPPRVTRVPTIQGPQTAVVVGPAGEEIFTDKYGRVKVQFHWDREGTNDASSSCWARVSSFWAGKNWGAVHIPRIGQEVIVSFEDGDPDHPIILGSVYNADQMPPYDLPDNKTQSGIKSRSTLQGGTDNYNEIRFEDKKGSELINIQAEKDMSTLVKNDETREVQHDRTTTIKNDETKTVQEGNEAITISQGNQTLDIKQGNQTITLDMGNQDTKLKMGNQSTKIDLGLATTEAMQSIELKVGQSSIKLDQTGVTIKGMMIKIQGQIQVQVQGMMTQINGDAMLQCKGGITMIN